MGLNQECVEIFNRELRNTYLDGGGGSLRILEGLLSADEHLLSCSAVGVRAPIDPAQPAKRAPPNRTGNSA